MVQVIIRLNVGQHKSRGCGERMNEGADSEFFSALGILEWLMPVGEYQPLTIVDFNPAVLVPGFELSRRRKNEQGGKQKDAHGLNNTLANARLYPEVTSRWCPRCP
jgi:hypothetical protein